MSIETNNDCTITGSKNWLLTLNTSQDAATCKAADSNPDQKWKLQASGIVNQYTISIPKSDGTLLYLSNNDERVSSSPYNWIVEASGSNYTITESDGGGKCLTEGPVENEKPKLDNKNNSDDQKWTFVFSHSIPNF